MWEPRVEAPCLSRCGQEFYFLSTFSPRERSLISSISLNSCLRNAIAYFTEAQGTDLKSANSSF